MAKIHDHAMRGERKGGMEVGTETIWQEGKKKECNNGRRKERRYFSTKE